MSAPFWGESVTDYIERVTGPKANSRHNVHPLFRDFVLESDVYDKAVKAQEMEDELNEFVRELKAESVAVMDAAVFSGSSEGIQQVIEAFMNRKV